MSAFSHNLNEISGYGITLRRLTHDKIELVRRWRNDPKIQQFMEYREEITPEMQEKWFQRIDNDNNLYFLIVIDNKEVGLINIRDIDYKTKQGEPGIFIWDDEYLNSTVSFQASLCLGDVCFENLGLKKLVIHVLKDNKRAIQYNKFLGYKLSSDQENIYNQEYTLVYADYLKQRNILIKLIK